MPIAKVIMFWIAASIVFLFYFRKQARRTAALAGRLGFRLSHPFDPADRVIYADHEQDHANNQGKRHGKSRCQSGCLRRGIS